MSEYGSEQEDLYYFVMSEIERIFGIKPTFHQMNEFFFDVVWAERERYYRLFKRHQKLVGALHTVRDYLED